MYHLPAANIGYGAPILITTNENRTTVRRTSTWDISKTALFLEVMYHIYPTQFFIIATGNM